MLRNRYTSLPASYGDSEYIADFFLDFFQVMYMACSKLKRGTDERYVVFN